MNADRPIFIEDLVKDTGVKYSTISTAFTRLTQLYPNAERIGKGIYRWSSKPSGIPVTIADVTSIKEFIVKVLDTKEDGTMLVSEEDSERLFVMKPLEW
jgi:hypothetical protein